MKQSQRWILGCVLLAAWGCGKSHDYGPSGTVEGRLTHNGSVLSPETKVVFIHSHNGVAAFGSTDSDGKYKIRTPHGDQVPIGPYRVMIQPPESELGGEEEPSAEDLLNDPNINRPQPNKSGFDFKYRQVSTSGLEYDVQEGKNTYEIDLK